MLAGKPSVVATELFFPPTKPWSESNGSVRLFAGRCRTCQTVAFPTPVSDICHVCGALDSHEPLQLSPVGQLYSFTEIHVAPKGFKTPYVVGYVDMPESVRLFGQVENSAAELTVGQRVAVAIGTVRTDPSGSPVTSYKFRSI